MPARLLFVSSNDGKVRDVEAALGRPVERLALDLPEIQALAVDEVARRKAREAFARTGQPVLVEDTGLYIPALGNLPGALVKWFLATIGPAGICALLPANTDRAAIARTAIASCDGGEAEVFAGETRGVIVAAPRGEGGFGWDAIFQPDGATKTFAEMDQAERTRYSMRRRALERLRERFEAGERDGARPASDREG